MDPGCKVGGAGKWLPCRHERATKSKTGTACLLQISRAPEYPSLKALRAKHSKSLVTATLGIAFRV